MTVSDTNKNNHDNHTLITAIAILVALASVTYALVVKSGSSDGLTAVAVTQTYEINDENPVVLAMNGRKVTRREIIDNFSKSNSELPADIDLQQIFPLLQDQYIIGELLEQAAYKEGITVNDPEIAEQLNKLHSAFGAFSQTLRIASGISRLATALKTVRDVHDFLVFRTSQSSPFFCSSVFLRRFAC